MSRIGAHMSIAGGLPLAVDRAVLHGCEALQVFTRSTGQWRARPLPDAEVSAFRARIDAAGIGPAVAHASYLINVAAPPGPLRRQSLVALGDELDRAERLGLLGVVLHPGAAIGASERVAVDRVASALRQVLRPRRRGRAKVLLEHTAGQGSTLGWRFEQLAMMIAALDGADRVGVCLDTCHLLAAGYDIRSKAAFDQTIRDFNRIVGLDRLALMHLNDSRTALGSRVDRHQHIGQGHVGLEGFGFVVRDRRFRELPMVIETPKTAARTAGVALDFFDVMNLTRLRELRGDPDKISGAGAACRPPPGGPLRRDRRRR
jgi:deoxyribonuclease IV